MSRLNLFYYCASQYEQTIIDDADVLGAEGAMNYHDSLFRVDWDSDDQVYWRGHVLRYKLGAYFNRRDDE